MPVHAVQACSSFSRRCTCHICNMAHGQCDKCTPCGPCCGHHGADKAMNFGAGLTTAVLFRLRPWWLMRRVVNLLPSQMHADIGNMMMLHADIVNMVTCYPRCHSCQDLGAGDQPGDSRQVRQTLTVRSTAAVHAVPCHPTIKPIQINLQSNLGDGGLVGSGYHIMSGWGLVSPPACYCLVTTSGAETSAFGASASYSTFSWRSLDCRLCYTAAGIRLLRPLPALSLFASTATAIGCVVFLFYSSGDQHITVLGGQLLGTPVLGALLLLLRFLVAAT